GPVAIVGATVIPMDSERVVENQTVVIESGRIRSMGPTPQIDVTNMRVVDGSGKYLLPALADMHVHHWDLSEAAMYLANGVAVVRNMWGASFHLAAQQLIDRGEVPGPRIITTSPLVDGLGRTGTTLWPDSGFITHPSQAKPLIERHVKQGFSQIKVYQQLTQEALSALGRASQEAGVMMVGHCPDDITYERSIDSGMGCFEHLTGIFTGHLLGGRDPDLDWKDPELFLRSMRTVVEHTDLDAMRKLGALLASRQVWNCPTITVHQGHNPTSEAKDSPLLDYLPRNVRDWWLSPYNAPPEHLRAETETVKGQMVDKHIEVLSILRQQGAPVVLGTDTPNPFVIPGFAIHDEFDNFVAAGFTPFEAIRCATSEAARFVDQSNDWGTIEVGKRADLLLVSDNPLSNVRNLREPSAIFVNGWALLREDLDRLLDDRRDKVNEPPHVAHAELEPKMGTHGAPINQRRFSEHRGGSLSGRVCCHCIPRPDGGQMIEETYSMAGGIQQTFRVFLNSGRRLERAECVTERELGRETTTVDKDRSGYRVTVEGLDGHERTSHLESGHLYPSESFGLRAFADVLKNLDADADEFEVLSITRGDADKTSVSIERTKTDMTTEFNVKIDRTGTPKKQTYRLDNEGQLESMDDLGWVTRKFAADESA
ncbi:MAG: amidohydrolase family protein, partial [Actinomycetota bacterium]